jgi:periplasmic protein TonB
MLAVVRRSDAGESALRPRLPEGACLRTAVRGATSVRCPTSQDQAVSPQSCSGTPLAQPCPVNRNLLLGILASSAVHVLWLAGAARASSAPKLPAAPTEIEIAVDQPAPPPTAPPVEEPPAPEPAPSAPAQNAATAQPTQAQAPANNTPQAAAQAGQTVTAPESESKGDDRADFTMVQGEGTNYAGGTTAAQGTATNAVRGPASPTGTGTAPPAPAAPAPRPTATADLSRGAMPASTDWNCSSLFPSDPEAGNSATVVIVVTVRPDGTPRSVSVMNDPGRGFGSAARSCALGQRYTAAHDRDGNPTTASTPPITVRFMR